MVDDDDPIRRGVDVELDRVRTALERAFERGEGVLRELASGAPVGDPFMDMARQLENTDRHGLFSGGAGSRLPEETTRRNRADLDLNGPTPVTSTVWTE